MRSFDEKSALLRPLCRPPRVWCSARPAEHGICHGRGSLGGAAGRGEIPASQTTIPALPQCASWPRPCDNRRIQNELLDRLYRHHTSAMKLRPGAPCLTGPAGH